jgi:hypothetical protein
VLTSENVGAKSKFHVAMQEDYAIDHRQPMLPVEVLDAKSCFAKRMREVFLATQAAPDDAGFIAAAANGHLDIIAKGGTSMDVEEGAQALIQRNGLENAKTILARPRAS